MGILGDTSQARSRTILIWEIRNYYDFAENFVKSRIKILSGLVSRLFNFNLYLTERSSAVEKTAYNSVE